MIRDYAIFFAVAILAVLGMAVLGMTIGPEPLR